MSILPIQLILHMNYHRVMMIYSGKGNSRRVPCTCSTRIRRATLIGLSFFSISSDKCTKKAEFASTRKLASFGLLFYSTTSLAKTLILTPSASGLSSSLPMTLTSKEKLMFEQFLKGIFIDCLLGIFIIFAPDLLSSSSFRHTIWGTSPRDWIGSTRGANQSICNSKVPEISVDSQSSGMLALMKRVKGSPSLIGTSISCTSSPFSTAFTVKILSNLQLQLLTKG